MGSLLSVDPHGKERAPIVKEVVEECSSDGESGKRLRRFTLKNPQETPNSEIR